MSRIDTSNKLLCDRIRSQHRKFVGRYQKMEELFMTDYPKFMKEMDKVLAEQHMVIQSGGFIAKQKPVEDFMARNVVFDDIPMITKVSSSAHNITKEETKVETDNTPTEISKEPDNLDEDEEEKLFVDDFETDQDTSFLHPEIESPQILSAHEEESFEADFEEDFEDPDFLEDPPKTPSKTNSNEKESGEKDTVKTLKKQERELKRKNSTILSNVEFLPGIIMKDVEAEDIVPPSPTPSDQSLQSSPGDKNIRGNSKAQTFDDLEPDPGNMDVIVFQKSKKFESPTRVVGMSSRKLSKDELLKTRIQQFLMEREIKQKLDEKRRRERAMKEIKKKKKKKKGKVKKRNKAKPMGKYNRSQVRREPVADNWVP